MRIRRFDLDRQGLTRVLGELEAQILETVWHLGQPRVKDVAAALSSTVHVKTVMTVMNRMVAKGLLRREACGRSFVYTAVLDREAFERQVAAQVLSSLLADFSSSSIEHVVGSATAQQLDELEQLVAGRRRQQEEP